MCQKWEGKVLGSKSDIVAALKRLNREPKDVNELQDIILKIRRNEMNQTAKDASNICNDFPD